MSEPHTICVPVYFSRIAKILDVDWTPETAKVLHTLKCDRGVYGVHTRADHDFLRSHARERGTVRL